MALRNAFENLAVESKQDQILDAILGLNQAEDVFGAQLIGIRYNAVEVHFDDTDYASYLTLTETGGGSHAQADGHVTFSTGTGANGRSKAVSLDVVKYRAANEIYAAFTVGWAAPGVANSYQWIGLGDLDNNGLFVGYNGTAFGLLWVNGGVQTFVAQADWDDPLDGSSDSNFTRNSTPEPLDKTTTNVWRVRAGLLGSAALILEIFSPDQEWIQIWILKRPNVSANPIFSNFDLPILLEARKQGADNTHLSMFTACWAGGTTSTKTRISDTITGRSLAELVQSVIKGKTNSGDYVEVNCNSQGRLFVTNDSAGTVGSAVPTVATQVGGSDGTNLRALSMDTAGRPKVRDDYALGEVLPDQSGVGGVLTFTFSAQVVGFWVAVVGVAGVCKVDHYGGTPSATAGIPVGPDAPAAMLPIPEPATVVKIYAPIGVTVTVWGHHR